MITIWITISAVLFTLLVCSWSFIIWVLKSISSNQKRAQKRGVCYACGTPLFNIKKFVRGAGKEPMGFKTPHEEE